MDEKLVKDLCNIICPDPLLICPEQGYPICHELKDIEQAFRDAGWHPQSKCHKIDLEKMPYIVTQYSHGNPVARCEKCIDWLKEQGVGG